MTAPKILKLKDIKGKSKVAYAGGYLRWRRGETNQGFRLLNIAERR